MTTTSIRGAARHRSTFAILATGVGAFAVLQSVVNPLLPVIQRELGATQSTVSWMVTGYLLAASVATPIIGRIGDAVGKQRMFVLTMLILTAGSALSAAAPTVELAILGRVIQGVGGGALPLAFGIIRDEFPPIRVGPAIGTIGALTAAGAGVGLVIAGPIETTLGFRALFWIPAAVTAVAAGLAAWRIPASPHRAAGRINIGDALLMSVWLTALLLGISRHSDWGWTVTGPLLAVAAAAAVLWVRAESRSPQPLVDMRMLRIPTVMSVNVTAFFLGVGMYAVLALLPQYLQVPASTGYGPGATVAQTGWMMLPESISSFAGGTVAGALAHRYGSRRMLLTGSALTAAGMGALAAAHDQTWQVVVLAGVIGFAGGVVFAAMSTLAVVAVANHQTGVSAGMNATFRTVGGAVGTAVVTAIVTDSTTAAGYPTASGYTAGFATLAVAALIATLAAAFAPRAPDTTPTLQRQL